MKFFKHFFIILQLTINGPEVYGPYIGDSEEKLRQIFEEANILISQSDRPCILFIDEIVGFKYIYIKFFDIF